MATSRDETKPEKIRRVLKERSQVEIFSTWVKKNIFSEKPPTETELIDETNSSTVSDTQRPYFPTELVTQSIKTETRSVAAQLKLLSAASLGIFVFVGQHVFLFDAVAEVLQLVADDDETKSWTGLHLCPLSRVPLSVPAPRFQSARHRCINIRIDI